MVTFDLKKEVRASRRPGGWGDAEGAKSLGEESRAQKVRMVRGGGQEMTSEAGLRPGACRPLTLLWESQQLLPGRVGGG